MDKLAFGKTMAPEPAQNQQNSVQAWRDALSNAQTQLEHQHNWCAPLRSCISLFWTAVHQTCTLPCADTAEMAIIAVHAHLVI